MSIVHRNAPGSNQYQRKINTLSLFNLQKMAPSNKLLIAKNTENPGWVLDQLANESDDRTRVAVAQNPSTRMSTLMRLARDPDRIVRIAVAINPCTSSKVLLVLAQDPDEDIRFTVASNDNADAVILDSFIQYDETIRILRRVAMHPNTSGSSLSKLAKYNRYTDDDSIRLNVALNTNTPPDSLSALLSEAQPSIKKAVLANPNTPANIRAMHSLSQ